MDGPERPARGPFPSAADTIHIFKAIISKLPPRAEVAEVPASLETVLDLQDELTFEELTARRGQRASVECVSSSFRHSRAASESLFDQVMASESGDLSSSDPSAASLSGSPALQLPALPHILSARGALGPGGAAP